VRGSGIFAAPQFPTFSTISARSGHTPIGRRRVHERRAAGRADESATMSKAMRDSVRRSIAFHEAGHAIACWSRRIKIHHATIIPARGYRGRVKHAPFRGIDPTSDNSARGDWRVKGQVIACLAGQEAQRRYSQRSLRHSDHNQAGGDYKLALDLALMVNASEEQATAYLKWLRIVTHDLVALRWPQIERVAGALFERETLTAEEIKAEILATFAENGDGPGVRLRQAP
jgi:hypothetical protein